MSIKTDLDTINESHEQTEIVMKYKDLFKRNSAQMTRLDQRVQSVADTTKFNAIPTDIKQAMSGYWQLIKDFNTAVAADPAIQELLTWSETEWRLQ